VRSTRSPSSIERLLGLGPREAPPHAFAVDGERLRYGSFAREPGGGYRFRAYHVEPLAPGSFQEGPLGGPPRDPAAFDAALGRLLERLGGPVREASLAVPDAWLRLAFSESGELPAAPRERDDVLRWKLRRLVPFRVEELRIDAVEVAPLPGQAEPRRLLIGFAAEALVAQLEAAFGRAGVRLGRITNASLAVLGALDPPTDDGGLTVLVVAEGGGYTLAVARAGEPVLHRHKGLAAGLPAAARGDFVRRDLALSRNFLAENAPGAPLAQVLLAAPDDGEGAWLTWLEEGLAARAEPLGAAHLPPLGGAAPALPWHELAPLLGAVRQVVA
jgi:hypothetical protein